MITFIRNFLRGLFSGKIFLVGVLVGALAVGLYVYKTQSLFKMDFFNGMFVEEISYKFQSYATKISGKQSLQVARLEQMEIYERTSRAKAFGLMLPEVVASAEFPVEYNFSVSLVAPWRFEKKENELIVHVPELSAQAPAINVSKIKFNVKKGSLLRNEDDAKERLREELHTFVVDNSIVLREKVREEARNSIRSFLQTWLAQTTGKEFNKNIKIYFPNEKEESKP